MAQFSCGRGAGAGVAGGSTGPKKRMRLLKRTSVDALAPADHTHALFKSDLTRLSHSLLLHPAADREAEGGLRFDEGGHAGALLPPGCHHGGLLRRASIADPHILKASGDPMISQSDRDLNSPVMFYHQGESGGGGGGGGRGSFD